jgi:hypothetical protein
MNRPRMLTRRLVPIGAAAVRVVFDAETFSVSAGGITAFAPERTAQFARKGPLPHVHR